jgi:hypothetical protein
MHSCLLSHTEVTCFLHSKIPVHLFELRAEIQVFSRTYPSTLLTAGNISLASDLILFNRIFKDKLYKFDLTVTIYTIQV